MPTGSSKGPKPRAPQKPPPKKPLNADGSVTHARYGVELGRRLCDRIANGEAWRSFCNTDGMPSYATLYSWRDKHPEFAQRLARARDIAADNRAEKALEVAERATSATATADRLHVNTLLWHASHGAPHRYGARAGAAAAATAKAEPRRVIIEVRRFVPFERPDGKLVTREILPDGSTIDYDR
ncbi:hypothetical protein [Phenylobacterium sp.]|uniref:terminase small subunit-like protein n=1 Tax=Phenylobacterium sp. TaxID=1871053 RepID=UPI003D2C5CA4